MFPFLFCNPLAIGIQRPACPRPTPQGANWTRMNLSPAKFFSFYVASRVYLPCGVCRETALANGWRGPLGKNRFLLFVDSQFGSVRWFETDRVSIRVKVPVNYGRARTLFNLAFGCLLSPEQLMACHDCIRFKGADYVFEIPGLKLPKFRIRMLRESNGVEIFSDSSHKGKLEVRAFYPDYAEKSEETVKKAVEMIEAFQNLLKNMIGQNYVKPDTGLGRV